MKINKHYLFLLTLILYVVSATSQEIKFDADNLLGTWNSYKVTTPKGDDGSDLTFNGKPFKKKIMMNFIDSKKMVFSINGSEQVETEYSMENSMIIIGYQKYTIIKFDKNQLILKEERLLGNLIYLQKDDS